jgi:hypothetical protein
MLELTGPADLDRLDMVHLRIRADMPDSKPGSTSVPAGKNTGPAISGAYRIKSGLQHTDPTGRAHGPFPLPKNDPYTIPLEESSVPRRQNDWHSWRGQYYRRPIWLEVTCSRTGYELWALPVEVEVQCFRPLA